MLRYAVLELDFLRWKIIRRNVYTAVAYCNWWEGLLSIDLVELTPTLLQNNHLLCGHIVCCLQRIEVSAASHMLSGLSLSTP